jgi:adenylate kinase
MEDGKRRLLVFAIFDPPFSILVFAFFRPSHQPPTMPTMRAFVSGQIGVDKGQYLNAVQKLARQNGVDLAVCHLGQMMYAEAPDVPQGRILNLPITRLNTLRRAAFKEVLKIADRHEHVLLNTHATFRWRHGLFAAFDFDQIKEFNAELYVTMLDNAESVHQRLQRDHDIDHTLKDIMVWREEEVLATEILANITRGYGHFYMVSRGRKVPTTQTVYRLMFEPHRKKVYLSFPMTHVMDLPDTLAEIDRFKSVLNEHFTTFDPADVDEFALHAAAIRALRDGETTIVVQGAEGPMTLKTTDVAQISGDIMGQIYARDFKMVDQSDMIISLVPELPNGKPALSSGVERELHHAFEGGKEVYVVWTCQNAPSPFITETATRLFLSVEEALAYFVTTGMIRQLEE